MRAVCLALRFSFVVTLAALLGAQETSVPAYRNPDLPVDRRVEDLLGRMTLEEKVAQLICLWPAVNIPANFAGKRILDDKGNFDPAKAEPLLGNGIGQIARPSAGKGPRENAEFTNAIQRYLVEKTRLGIPAVFHEEGLHGHMAPGGTSFPQAIALAATWNPELVEQVFGTAAAEMRARGGHQALTPVLDLALDARWGRFEETYGEDPYLTSRLGVGAIRGFQGAGPLIDKRHVVATMKHFAVHGRPEGGTNVGPANYSERYIRETFLRPFEAAVKDAGVGSVMACYNEIDGIPCHANRWLLDRVLRQEWGFRGYVVSDYFGIRELKSLHSVARDVDEAAKMAMDAGVDVELPDPEAYNRLAELAGNGTISEAAIDQAVRRALRAKFLLGLFEDPYADPAEAERITNTSRHRELALRAAREAIILLKNEGGVLPFDRSSVKTIAVVGPNAAKCLLGGYSDDPGRCVTVLDGIRSKLGNQAKVLYAEGCKITKEGADWWADKVELSDPAEDRKGIVEAARLAVQADATVVVVGGNDATSREAYSPTHLGDRDSLELLGLQNELVKAVLEAGKPAAVLLLHGRPLSINYIAENVPAILDGWYLGQEGGTAVADVLFGDYNPAGRLPVSIPRSVGQVPVFYNHKPSAKRGYLFANKEPLFAFGYGLSYTQFRYQNLNVMPEKIGPRGAATVSVDVTNTGQRAGDEVVQVYIRDVVSSVTRPVKELRGFRRIPLGPGETRTVEFTIGPAELSLINRDMERVVEPGEFEIMAGGSSVQVIKTSLEVVVR